VRKIVNKKEKKSVFCPLVIWREKMSNINMCENISCWGACKVADFQNNIKILFMVKIHDISEKYWKL